MEPNFEKVANTFDAILKEYPPQAHAQVAVYHQGRLVVDLAGSAANTPQIQGDTPFMTFSVSKAFTAMAILRLVEEGRVELDAPVGQYWPAFAQGGKEKATVRHALCHQAGIPAPHLRQQVLLWPFWRLVTRQVAGEKAIFPPGTQTAYHLVNFGFILGEIVRRVTGQSIHLFLKKNFFEPMGLQYTWMRLPLRKLRQTPKLVAMSPEHKTETFLFNLPAIRTALMPAAGLHSTARELGAFFQMLLDGGVYQGKRYLQLETIALGTTSQYDGFDAYLQSHINWGFGMVIGGSAYADPDPRKSILGHGSSAATFSGLGMGTCMVWADRRARLVTAFTTNGMLREPGVNERWAKVSNAVWDSLVG